MTMSATQTRTGFTMVAAIVALPLLGAGAHGQAPPDRENGRFTFSQSSDGSLVRLDTRSGSVAICRRGGAGFACYTTPDERDAFDKEIGRLQAENARLKDQLAKRDLAEPGAKTEAQLPKSDSLKGGEIALADKPGVATPQAGKPQADSAKDKGNRIELQLPDDKEIDRVVAFIERAWRKLIDAAIRIQRDVAGQI